MSAEVTLVLVSALVAVLAFEFLRVAWRRWRGTARAKRRAARALRGEAHAAKLLTRAGYQLLDEQLTRKWVVRLGQDERTISLRADYLVTDGARTLIAEVKTGELAPDIGNAATRRQLLEYLIAYEVDGVLLVDAERGVIDEVDFPLVGEAGEQGTGGDATSRLLTRLAWLGAGGALALGLSRWLG